MSLDRASGTMCRIQKLCYLVFIHWALSGLPISSHAASSEFKSGYHKVNHLVQEAFFVSNSNDRQHLLETLPSVRNTASYYASALSPSLSPTSSPGPLPALFPSDPPVTVPYSPAPGALTIPTGNCSINFTAIETMFYQTAADCGDPLAVYVGVAICCPQFDSLLRIIQAQNIAATGDLGLNNTEAESCFSEIVDTFSTKGTNSSSLCRVQPANLTVGSCPVTTMTEFDLLVNTSSLLLACETIDPLKECVTNTCQSEIGNATLDLAQGFSETVYDCESVVLSWLASHSSPDQANDVLRFLSSCAVNKVCPLVFSDISQVAMKCNSSSLSKVKCCGALTEYMQSKLQTQMLITNQQAYKCADTLGLDLQGQGVTSDIYTLCNIHLSDFSLQDVFQFVWWTEDSEHGSDDVDTCLCGMVPCQYLEQHKELMDGKLLPSLWIRGCLLPSQPTDINITAGGSFICDLNDNILAEWPLLSETSLGSPSPSPLPALASVPAPSPLPSLGTSFYIAWSGLRTIICALTAMALSVNIS